MEKLLTDASGNRYRANYIFPFDKYELTGTTVIDWNVLRWQRKYF